MLQAASMRYGYPSRIVGVLANDQFGQFLSGSAKETIKRPARPDEVDSGTARSLVGQKHMCEKGSRLIRSVSDYVQEEDEEHWRIQECEH